MKIALFEMFYDIIHGPAKKRVVALTGLTMCFAAGALASSLVLAVIDPFVSANLSHSTSSAAVVGGALCAALSSIKIS